ncbi:polysaccharide pyruvyl transferase family protein [Pararhizobium sp. PWRC1-1]|uniref:polysaccharide pyruvyl transferase family protein n=1 Tax=Pararhizobium sp. PWRC1-1 TaxID=2804566 RepID=UPI003CF34AF1
MMIYNHLIESGYSVKPIDVESTHFGLPDAPLSPGDQDFFQFYNQLKLINPFLHRAIERSDLIVVNGEGTIHGFHAGCRQLLSLIYVVKNIYKRSVHLINHSCFPSAKSEGVIEERDLFYKACLEKVDRIVVRESKSQLNYCRLSISSELGFDCLPLFVSKYTKVRRAQNAVVIGAASYWSPEVAASVAREIRLHINDRSRVIFLSGGHKHEPPEDIVHFESMQQEIPNLEISRPTSIDDWMAEFRSASLLITGRFHHYIAAAAVRTPAVIFRGNTEKSDAVAAMLNHPPAIDERLDDWKQILAQRLSAPSRTSPSQVRQILKLAKVNFASGTN